MAEKVEPFIPADKFVPELTVRALIIGALLAVLMGATNAYLGLKVGMTVSATIPAAVICLAIYKAIGGSILETNLSKTMASAGESLAAGVIFTVPAFIIINAWAEIRYVETTFIAMLGGILGVLFTISLRRVLVVEEDLPFPEGVASAEVLFAGWEGGSSAKSVFTALAIGFGYKALGALSVVEDKVQSIIHMGKVKGFFGGDMSAALVSVGYIIGPRISGFVFLGGLIGWVFVLPMFLTQAFAGNYPGIDPLTTAPMEMLEIIRIEQIMWIGIGAIVFGGIWTMFTIRGSVGGAFKEAIRGIKGEKIDRSKVPRTEKDMPVDKAMLAAAALVIPIGGLFFWLTGSGLIAGVTALIMVVAAFFFTAISGYMAGVLGSSNNPISGVTITVLLFSSILLFALGARGPSGMAGALAVGSVVACAAAIAGDVLQDFKTGQIVGSTPKNLQVGEVIGVVATAFTIAPILMILDNAYGIGSPELAAPQAQAMGGVLQAFFGGTVNFGMFLAGMELAVLLILFGFPVLAVAIGIYLPFSLSTPIMLGGVLHAIVDRAGRKKHGGDIAGEKLHNKGILYASGLIAGEALMGIVGAVVIISFFGDGGIPWKPIPVIGIVAFIIVVALLFKNSIKGVGGSFSDAWQATGELIGESIRKVKEFPSKFFKF